MTNVFSQPIDQRLQELGGLHFLGERHRRLGHIWVGVGQPHPHMRHQWLPYVRSGADGMQRCCPYMGVRIKKVRLHQRRAELLRSCGQGAQRRGPPPRRASTQQAHGYSGDFVGHLVGQERQERLHSLVASIGAGRRDAYGCRASPPVHIPLVRRSDAGRSRISRPHGGGGDIDQPGPQGAPPLMLPDRAHKRPSDLECGPGWVCLPQTRRSAEDDRTRARGPRYAGVTGRHVIDSDTGVLVEIFAW